MGYFQAYAVRGITTTNGDNIAADTPVFFTSTRVSSAPPTDKKTPTAQEYYSIILSEALKGSDYTLDKNFSKIYHPNRRTANDNNILINIILEEESKYYWKWLDNDHKEIKDQGSPILNRLYTMDDYSPSFKDKFNNATANQTSELNPLVIQELSENNQYYPVTLNENTTLLFLDATEDTQRYHYKKEGDIYKKQRTFIYRNDFNASSLVGGVPDYKDWGLLL